jgi:hypothetical protein
MWKRTFVVLAFALALFFPHSSSLSLPFFFGLDSKLRSLTAALEKDSATQLLDLLRYYDLQQICHHGNQPRTNLTGVAIASPYEIWRDGGDLLELSLPSIFRNVTINGDWNDAAKRTRILADCPAVGRYGRSARLAYIQQITTNTRTEV